MFDWRALSRLAIVPGDANRRFRQAPPMQQMRKPERARDPEARGAAPKSSVYEISVDLLKVSAMRIPLTVMIVAIATLASPLAYGQASGKGQTGTHGTSGKPSGPAAGGGDSILVTPTQRAVAPSSGALSDLAGGGYADPNYVPPTTQSKKSTRHRVIRAPRVRTSRHFEQYGVDPAFPYRYCYCDY